MRARACVCAGGGWGVGCWGDAWRRAGGRDTSVGLARGRCSRSAGVWRVPWAVPGRWGHVLPRLLAALAKPCCCVAFSELLRCACSHSFPSRGCPQDLRHQYCQMWCAFLLNDKATAVQVRPATACLFAVCRLTTRNFLLHAAWPQRALRCMQPGHSASFAACTPAT